MTYEELLKNQAEVIKLFTNAKNKNRLVFFEKKCII